MQFPLLQLPSIVSHLDIVSFWEKSSLHCPIRYMETGLKFPLSKAVFSPGWTSPAPTASHQRTSAPDPDHCGGPPLNLIWYGNVLLVLESPRRDTVLQPQTHKRNIEGKNNFPWSAGYSFILLQLGVQLCVFAARAHCCQIPFCQTTSQPAGATLYSCMVLRCPGGKTLLLPLLNFTIFVSRCFKGILTA